ncbi:hypothetical protein NP511_02645 [Natrinema thermotolerans]|uniref:Uncharacterized protein n=1 Tax=Natrinema thermotolerans TaxID=121872 RepID=A0AAF0PFZ9_9EURY|nr:hypothetical protein [Natrinema thermotolerans]QCC57464.1 hypothetical protein DVR14_01930 [Natrinema thermotolerans]WMT08540.1 hypothetical protein NP511_02645 [Natrinema thermotolerans]
MKTLEVTDEQYAFIQHLREEISESVVGKYGFVREQDAVQFLIDNLDEEIELEADGEFDSSATDDVAASVGAAIDGEADPHDLEEVSYIEGEAPGTDGVVDDADGDEDLESESDDPAEPVDDDASDADEGADDDGEDGGGDESDADDESDTDGDDGSDDDGSADDDDMLDEMMSLLETHDDKWEEAASADYRYSVDLPDGSTEQVQTKDDVRALLFKNYR